MPTDSVDTAEGEHEHKGVSSLLTVNPDHDPEDLKIIAKLILGVDLAEVYSPQRVVRAGARFGLQGGSSMDLTIGWDFDLPEHRKKAEEQIAREQPHVLVGSPPCTFFFYVNEIKHC